MHDEIDIVVPVYDEEETVTELVARLRVACPQARLIFVDNASRDRTCERLAASGVVDIVRHAENLGYGRSLLDGMRAGSGRLVIVIDADLEYLPEDVPLLVTALADAEAVHGSRFLAADRRPPAMQWYRALGNGLVTSLFNALFRQNLTDLYTGIRGFHRAVLPLDALESPGFEFVLELSARLAHAGARIVEVPARYEPRSSGRSKMRHIPEFVKFARRLVELRLGLGPSPRRPVRGAAP